MDWETHGSAGKGKQAITAQLYLAENAEKKKLMAMVEKCTKGTVDTTWIDGTSLGR
jgi:hypothetical protein